MDIQSFACGGPCYPNPQAWADRVVAYIRSLPADANVEFKDLVGHDQTTQFLGTVYEAEIAGWRFGEFGPVCPACATNPIVDAAGASAVTEDNLLTHVAVIAKLRRNNPNLSWGDVRGLTKMVEKHIAGLGAPEPDEE